MHSVDLVGPRFRPIQTLPKVRMQRFFIDVNVSVHLISSTLVLIDLFNFVVNLIKVGVELLHPCTIVYDLNEQGIKVLPCLTSAMIQGPSFSQPTSLTHSAIRATSSSPRQT